MNNILTNSDTKYIIHSLSGLADLRLFVSSQAEDFGFKTEDTYKISMAVDEACTNIIKHAYNNNPNQEIEVNCEFESGKMSISIIDEGNPFDLKSSPTKDMSKYFSEFQKGGLGIQIIKLVMDEVEYFPEITPHKNLLKLSKYLGN